MLDPVDIISNHLEQELIFGRLEKDAIFGKYRPVEMDGTSEVKNEIYGGNNFSNIESQMQDMSSNRKVKEDKGQIV